jgi:FAD/FMN-containing dehydrogenase
VSADDAALTRRTVIGAGLAGLAAVLAGCGGSGHHGSSPPSSRPTLPDTSAPTTAAAPSTTSTTATGPLDASAWNQLASSLSGHLVLPSDAAYAVDCQLFDFRYDNIHPAGIAYCATPDDVARSIAFARQYDLTPTPRAGGHSYAGYSTGTGLVVDVTLMASVSPQGAPGAPGSAATIGAGARLIDIYSQLNGSGVSIPGGSCPTVGIAGLALGGGLGVVGRQHGLTCDNIASLQMVTADGRILTASPTSNPDLYWACRGGGGGNFGVVTSFVFNTFATAPVVLFTLNWPWSAADQVLPAWQQWAPAAPDALWSNCLLATGGPATPPSIKVAGVYEGSVAGASALLAELQRSAGAASGSYLGSAPFATAMYIEAGCSGLTEDACHLPTQAPGGQLPRAPSSAKSDFLTSVLSDGGVSVVIDALNARYHDGAEGSVAYDACGGAIGQPAPDATAFVHRNAICSAQYSFQLVAGQAASVVAASQQWLDDLYAALRPYVSGQAYQNYIDPALTDWEQAYYGANLPRLESVKQTYDPDDVFHFPQSIPVP